MEHLYSYNATLQSPSRSSGPPRKASDVRTTLETHGGAPIYVAHKGIWDLGREGYAKVLRGESLPSGLHIRTTPVFHTSHPAYQWLHRLHCLMGGEVFPDEADVSCDVSAIR